MTTETLGWFEDLFRAIALPLAVLFAAGLIEAIIPFRAQRRGFRRTATNLTLTMVTFVMYFTLNGAIAGAAAVLGDAAPFPVIAGMEPVAAVIVSVIVLDGFSWLAHLLMHKVPFLWRIHKVHHSDPVVDATTTYRQHPFESVVRTAFSGGPVLALGLPPLGFAVYRMLSALNAILEHVNIKVPLRLDTFLTMFWVTPNMHKVHHSRHQPETDSNYANLFAFWDRLFATFTPSERAAHVEYGLDTVPSDEADRMGRLLSMPFRK